MKTDNERSTMPPLPQMWTKHTEGTSSIPVPPEDEAPPQVVREIPLIAGSTPEGIMLYDPSDGVAGHGYHFYGEYSPHEKDVFTRFIQPHHTAVDVGAQIGAHAIAMARLGQHVYAYEMNPTVFAILRANVYLNGLERKITPILGQCGCAAQGHLSIDALDLDITNLSLIKVDVDGPEIEVLEGAKRCIEKFSPVLYVENDRPERAQEEVDYIYSINYTPFWHPAPLYRDENPLGRVVLGADRPNITLMMLCIPNLWLERSQGKFKTNLPIARRETASQIMHQTSDSTWTYDIGKMWE